MKVTPLILIVLLVSCTKNRDVSFTRNEQPANREPEVCNFGMQVFSKAKRAPVPDLYVMKKKPGRDSQPPVTSDATIFLDFDGALVSKTLWNINGDINCAPANLLNTEVDKIVRRVSEDYSPFNVTITTDEAVYNATNPNKRIRVIITETWEWFGQAGGTSYIGSFTWGDNTPCFVFSTLMQYNEKYIAEGISHEVGHTLGLRHQAVYDGGCTFLNEYNYGWGEGLTSWAPIMGVGYYKNLTTWHKGPTTGGCNAIQDDVAVLSGTLGFVKDDNTGMNRAVSVTDVAEGLINDSDDIDYYSVDLKSTSTITVEPSVLANGEGANTKLELNIYDKQGRLLSTADDPNILSSAVTLNKGKYYIGVQTEANQEQSRYGMLGRYTLRVK